MGETDRQNNLETEEFNMERYVWCRELWDRCLAACPACDAVMEGRRHTASVSAIAGGLARLRGEDEELARIAGLLHDLWAVETGIRKEHAHRGAERARELLESACSAGKTQKQGGGACCSMMGAGKEATQEELVAEENTVSFTKEEVDEICAAIYFHSDKHLVHGPQAEILKDADLLDRFLDCPDYDPGSKSTERLARLRAELGDLQLAARRLVQD